MTEPVPHDPQENNRRNAQAEAERAAAKEAHNARGVRVFGPALAKHLGKNWAEYMEDDEVEDFLVSLKPPTSPPPYGTERWGSRM